MASLTAINVGKRYPNGKQALSGVSFLVRSGAMLGVIGHNGAGKSTLLNILAGLIRPTTGTIELSHPRQRVMWAPQRTMVDWSLTVRQNIELTARLTSSSPGRVDEILGLLDLEKVRDQQAEYISGGQLQRVQIARALVADAPAYILDEPAAGLDPAAAVLVMAYLRARAAEDRIVLVSSHDLDAIERTASDLLLLNGGRVHANMPVQEFIARAGGLLSVRVSLSEPLTGDGAAALDQARPDGWSLTVSADRHVLDVEVPLAVGLHQILRWLPPGLPVKDISTERQSLRDIYLARYAAERENVSA